MIVIRLKILLLLLDFVNFELQMIRKISELGIGKFFIW